MYTFRKSRTKLGLSARSSLVRPKQSRIWSGEACTEEHLMQGAKHLLPRMYLRNDRWPLRKREMDDWSFRLQSSFTLLDSFTYTLSTTLSFNSHFKTWTINNQFYISLFNGNHRFQSSNSKFILIFLFSTFSLWWNYLLK